MSKGVRERAGVQGKKGTTQDIVLQPPTLHNIAFAVLLFSLRGPRWLVVMVETRLWNYVCVTSGRVGAQRRIRTKERAEEK